MLYAVLFMPESVHCAASRKIFLVALYFLFSIQSNMHGGAQLTENTVKLTFEIQSPYLPFKRFFSPWKLMNISKIRH